jgi:Holliday junction resolvase-like predicted endonuclease
VKLAKSTRHSKITGNFGEALVLYWLSKYGFECANVDHTGIDLIAQNPHTKERIGISVKSRCRPAGKESEYLRIPADDFDKVETACSAFGCVPYFAIVIEAGPSIQGFIISMEHLLSLYPRTPSGVGWQMTAPYLRKYSDDSEIFVFEMKTETKRWWSQTVV